MLYCVNFCPLKQVVVEDFTNCSWLTKVQVKFIKDQLQKFCVWMNLIHSLIKALKLFLDIHFQWLLTQNNPKWPLCLRSILRDHLSLKNVLRSIFSVLKMTFQGLKLSKVESVEETFTYYLSLTIFNTIFGKFHYNA